MQTLVGAIHNINYSNLLTYILTQIPGTLNKYFYSDNVILCHHKYTIILLPLQYQDKKYINKLVSIALISPIQYTVKSF